MDSKGVNNHKATPLSSTSSVNDASRSNSQNDSQSVTKQIPANSSSGVPDTAIQDRKPLILQRDEQLRAALRSWQLYSPPSHIPSEVSTAATQKAKVFKSGVEKTVSTGVPGTETLQFSTAHSVIKTPKGYLHVPYGKKLAPGFHITDQGHRVHSSTIAVDAPFLSCASSFKDQVWVDSFCNRQQPAPDGTWLQSQLSSEPERRSPQSTRMDALLQKTIDLDDNHGLPEDQLHGLQDKMQKQEEQLERIDTKSKELKTVTQELVAETTRLTNQLTSHTQKVNQQSAEIARTHRDTHTVPQAGSAEHDRLKQKLTTLETSLSEAQSENSDLKITQKKLLQELDQKQQTVEQQLQELKQLKLQKTQLDADFASLTDESRTSKITIEKLQTEKERLALQIRKQEALLVEQQQELTAINDSLTSAKQAYTDYQSEILALKQQLAQLTSEKNDTARVLFSVKQQLAASEEKNAQIEANLTNANEKLQDALTKIKELRTATNTNKFEKEQWEKEYLHAQHTIGIQNARITELESHNHSIHEQCQVLISKNRETTESLKDTQTQLRDTTRKLKATDDDFNELCQAHKQLKEKSEKQEDDIYHLEEKNIALEGGLHEANTQIKEFEKKNVRLLEAITKSSPDAPADNPETAVIHILNKNSELAQQLANRTTDCSQAIVTQKQQQHEIKTLQAALRKQQVSLSETTEKLQHTEEALQERVNDIKFAAETIRKTTAAAKKQLTEHHFLAKQNKELSDKVVELKRSDTEKDEEIKLLRTQLQKAHERSAALDQSQQLLHEQLEQEKRVNASNTATIETLKSEAQSNAQRNLELQLEINTLRKQLLQGQKIVEYSAVKLEAQQQILQTADIRFRALESKLSQQATQLTHKDKEIERLQEIAEKTAELSKENKILMERLTKAQKAKTILTKLVNDYIHKYSHHRKKIKNLALKMSFLDKELKIAQNYAKELKEEREGLSARLLREQENRRAANSETREVKFKISQKEGELSIAKKRIKSLEKLLDNSQKEIESLQKVMEGDFTFERHQDSTKGKPRPEKELAGRVYDMQKTLDNKIINLQLQLEEAAKTISTQKSSILKKEIALSELQNKYLKSKTDNHVLSEELQSALTETEAQAEETKRISQQLVEACSEIEKSKADSKLKMTQWEEERKRLNAQLSQQLAEIESAAKDREKLALENAFLKTAHKQELDTKEAQLATLKELNNELQSTTEKWKVISENKGASLSAAEEKNSTLEKELKDKQLQYTRIMQEKETLTQEQKNTTEAMLWIEHNILQQVEGVSKDFVSQNMEDSLQPQEDTFAPPPEHIKSSIQIAALNLKYLIKSWQQAKSEKFDLYEQLSTIQEKLVSAESQIEKEINRQSNAKSDLDTAITQREEAQKEAEKLKTELAERDQSIEKIAKIIEQKESEIKNLEQKLEEFNNQPPSKPEHSIESQKMVTEEEHQKTIKEMQAFCTQLNETHAERLKHLQEKYDKIEKELQDKEDAELQKNQVLSANRTLADELTAEKHLLQTFLDQVNSSFNDINALISQIQQYYPGAWSQKTLVKLLEDLETKLTEGDDGWKKMLQKFAESGVEPSRIDDRKAKVNAYVLLKSHALPQEDITPPSSRRSSLSSDSGISTSSRQTSDSDGYILESSSEDEETLTPHTTRFAKPLPPNKVPKPALIEPDKLIVY